MSFDYVDEKGQTRDLISNAPVSTEPCPYCGGTGWSWTVVNGRYEPAPHNPDRCVANPKFKRNYDR